ncbi:MAG: hypothetical protein LBR53_01805 [Deltaproteobacteria bacterium]|nr:hypothetical protein [Deltaproteobacteria bacterium]
MDDDARVVLELKRRKDAVQTDVKKVGKRLDLEGLNRVKEKNTLKKRATKKNVIPVGIGIWERGETETAFEGAFGILTETGKVRL